MAFAFKEIGFVLNPAFDDKDYALTFVGDIGILINGLSRYFWASLGLLSFPYINHLYQWNDDCGHFHNTINFFEYHHLLSAYHNLFC